LTSPSRWLRRLAWWFCYHGAFSRRFTLPTAVEAGNVTAQSRDGVLRILLPKKAETKPRQIKVQAGAPSLGVQGNQKQ
jgi:hypothetical protein